MSFLPSDDRQYLDDHNFVYREISDGGQKGIILSDFAVPECKFQVQNVDVLILLPQGYPDVPPDMFYTLPWLQLASSGRYPDRADQPMTFNSDNWQRWSRHSSEWRTGTDGIRTMIQRVERALRETA